MTTSERRYTHRYRLKVPLVFCPMHSPLTNGHQEKSINISSRGVYFVTSHPVFVGLPVQVYLRMPRRIAGTLPTERVADGGVTHIEWKNVPRESSGVGVCDPAVEDSFGWQRSCDPPWHPQIYLNGEPYKYWMARHKV